MRALIVATTIAAAGGCLDLDHEVVPDVVRAELAADRSAPDELAFVDITLRLSAGSDAHRTIELWDVWLMEPARDVSSHRLKLALPGTNLELTPNETIVVELVNVGTTNADLTPLCGRLVDVLLNIRYLDDGNGFTDVEPPRVKVACN